MPTKKYQVVLAPRSIRVLTASLLGVALFTGCSSGQSTTPGAQTPASSPKGDLNVVVSSATGSDAGFQAVNKAFAAKYPGVEHQVHRHPQRELRRSTLIPAERGEHRRRSGRPTGTPQLRTGFQRGR